MTTYARPANEPSPGVEGHTQSGTRLLLGRQGHQLLRSRDNDVPSDWMRRRGRPHDGNLSDPQPSGIPLRASEGTPGSTWHSATAPLFSCGTAPILDNASRGWRGGAHNCRTKAKTRSICRREADIGVGRQMQIR
jgi:hypothetical protein